MYNTVITRHNLLPRRLERVYGSQENANCTEFAGENICAGTSVLNDGIIPNLDGVNTSNSTLWASQLFTLNVTRGIIRLSFEVDSENHDCMELAVFNCPEMRINLPSFSIYFDSSFRPDRNDGTLGTLIMESRLMATSCDHLLVFCVEYNTTQSTTLFINLVITDNISNYVFLGEVTFVHGGNEPCDLAMPTKGIIQACIHLSLSKFA